jgi:hypothetical protein
MSFTATVFRVLIASPGDLAEERKTIEDTIHQWNADEGFDAKVVLLPVRWETHAVPEQGDRPQGILNRRLVDHCDILIGAFWTRIGSPTGSYASGTLEEIDRFFQSGRPTLLYFSTRDARLADLDLEQYRQVVEVKQRFKARGLFDEFSSPHELAGKLSRHLREHVRRLTGGEVANRVRETAEVRVVNTTKRDRTFRYEEYWNGFSVALKRSGSDLRPPTVREKNWVRFPAGGSGARIFVFASTRERYLGVELVLERPDGDGVFANLKSQRSEIERAMGDKLKWSEHSGSNRISLTKDGLDPARRSDWTEQYEWLIDKLELFHRVLVQRLSK